MTLEDSRSVTNVELIYFSSVSENTRRFIDRLDLESARIPLRRTDTELIASKRYVLVTPTYGGEVVDDMAAGAVPKQVIRFLNNEGNRSLIRGVISAGNTNFGAAYGIAGNIIAAKCKVPSLYRFELMGTEHDVETVKEGLAEFWKNH